MATDKQPKPIQTGVAVAEQSTLSSLWNNFLPTSWFQSSTDKDKGVSNKIATTPKALLDIRVEQTPVQQAQQIQQVQKAEQDVALFAGWTQLQSAHSSNMHTIKNYQIVEDANLEDLCVLEVAKEELEDARKAEQKAEQDYLKKYASKEYFSHILPYDKTLVDGSKVNGSKVKGLEEDGSEAEYECHRLESDHKGIVGFVLLPTKPNTEGRYDIKVLFRGTEPSDTQCLKRNLEPRGAGSVSFEVNSLSLLSQVNQHIKAFSEKHTLSQSSQKGLSLGVYGHSLGGADAQNFSTKVLQVIAEQNGIATSGSVIPKDAVDQLGLIKKLHLNTANSAGVPLETAKLSNDLVKKLSEKREQNQTDFEIPESYNLRVGGDGVQATGQAHVLNNVTSKECKVDLLKAHIGSEHHNKLGGLSAAVTLAGGVAFNGVTAGVSGTLATIGLVGSALAGIKDTDSAHRSKLFNKPRAATFEMLSNATPAGQEQVAKELAKKSGTLNGLQSFVEELGNGFPTLKAAFGWGTKEVKMAAENGSNNLTPAIQNRLPLVFSTAATEASSMVLAPVTAPSLSTSSASLASNSEVRLASP